MKKVQHLVKDKFNVDYSLKQIDLITKKLSYNYSTLKSNLIKKLSKNTKHKINIFITIFTTTKSNKTTIDKNETNNEKKNLIKTEKHLEKTTIKTFYKAIKETQIVNKRSKEFIKG